MLPTVTHDLQRTSPERQGIASAAVLQFVEALESQIHEIHSFMLLRHGSVIAEGWWSPYGREHPHLLFSLSKSFTSTAVGLAIAEGYFSIDDPVLSFFPDETPAGESELLAGMCVRHLLSMSTGQAEDTWSYVVDRPDGNWIKGFFSVPVVHTPGTHFLYNTGATYMLSAIVQKTTGMKLVDYLTPRLFEPLGIEKAAWSESPQGITAGGIGLSLKTEDVARFGQLYLQKGRWQGNQLLPEAWIDEATTFQISNADGAQPDWSQGYGYQFWRCRHGAYRGDGVFGQYCIVMPEQDAVLAITSGMDVFDMQQPLNLVWEILLPAMQPDALPDDAADQDRLTKKLSSLAMMPVQGKPESPVSSQISGRSYAVDANDLKIETIALNFTESGCVISIKTAANEETIPCGYGEWQLGQTALFNQPLLFDNTPITASGAWRDADTFTMIVRLYQTPFFHTLVYHFVGDEMMVEVSINVSLESLKPLLLTAHAV
ncbi:MAG: beta-lactamase family protein [Anaerolineae bacterium]|nr:beta-lactamase family protein [Anaerolineae bacterium]